MDLEPNLPLSLGIIAAIIAAGTVGLLQIDAMATDTTLMMVLPSMVAFAAVVFVIGVKHGEFRTS